MAKLGSSFNRLLTASALSNLADGVFQIGLRLLLGFLVITDERIEAADTVHTT